LRSLLLSVLTMIVCLVPGPSAANGRFTFDNVSEIARKVAAEPYRPPPPVPEFLTTLSYDDYRDIRFDTNKSWWRDSGNFQIQFIHPGLYYGHSVKINTIDASGVSAAGYSPQLF